MTSETDFQPKLPDAGAKPAWALRAQAVLDEDAAALDAETRARLQRARQSALADAGARPAWWHDLFSRPRLWLPAALAASLALALVMRPDAELGPHFAPAASTTQLQDLDLLQGDESPELYENQEFYAWLAESEPSPG
jgi:hypothetical protein